MGQAFKQLWSAFTTTFKALDVLMLAVLHLCSWAEQTSGQFEDDARLEREAKLLKRREAMLVVEQVQPTALPESTT